MEVIRVLFLENYPINKIQIKLKKKFFLFKNTTNFLIIMLLFFI
jgi:hypothetical protein